MHAERQTVNKATATLGKSLIALSRVETCITLAAERERSAMSALPSIQLPLTAEALIRCTDLLDHAVAKWKSDNIVFKHSFHAACLVIVNHQIRVWHGRMNSAPTAMLKWREAAIAAPSPVTVCDLPAQIVNLNQNI